MFKSMTAATLIALVGACVPASPGAHRHSNGDRLNPSPLPAKPGTPRPPGYYRDLIGYTEDGKPIYRDTIVEPPNRYKASPEVTP